MDPSKLKMDTFAREFLATGKGPEAAVAAGFKKGAWKRLLASAYVQNRLEEYRRQQAERLELKADRVLLELARVAFADIGECFDAKGRVLPVHEMSEKARRALAGLEVDEWVTGDGRTSKIKHLGKVEALKLLGQHFKLFEGDGEAGQKVSIKIITGKTGADK